MNLDETQAIGQDSEEEEEEEVERSRKVVGHLKVFKHQDSEEKIFNIYEGENFIGRDESSDVYIPRKSLSKTHACIEVIDNLHVIYDNDSKNKTRRDKVILRPQVRYELKNKDMLTLADLSLQYIIEDIHQDDDDDDTGSETGSESMLPIDTATGVHDAVDKDDSAKQYAAETDSETDDEKTDKQSLSKTAGFENTDDKAMTIEAVKPKVPNIMYDSSDDETIEKPLQHDDTTHQDDDSAVNISSEGTLAFGLVSPSDGPFIRPTPKQAVNETPATVVLAADSQGDDLKSSTPGTLIYSESSPEKYQKPSLKRSIQETPATMVYSVDNEDTSNSKSATPGTLLYGGEDSPDTSPSRPDNQPRTSDEIFLPETQGFTPHDVSVCAPTQAYVEDTPVGTEEKQQQVRNIPDSGDDDDDDSDVKKVLTFDESATQAYTWNDSDATNDEEEDEDDDLRYQATQAYPSNPQENRGFSSDEHSNPDLYATTRQEHHSMIQTKDSEENEMEEKHTEEPSMREDFDFMETQAYQPNDKNKSEKEKGQEELTMPKELDHRETRSSSTSNKKEIADTNVTLPTQPYGLDEDNSGRNLTKQQESRKSLQAVPETLAYDIDEDSDKTFAKPFPKDGQSQNIEPTLPYMMETQAYDVNDDDDTDDDTDDDDHSNRNITSIENVTSAQNADQTEQPNMIETQAYNVDDDDETDDETDGDCKPNEKKSSVEKDVNTKQKVQFDMMETQAYNITDETDDDDEIQPGVKADSKTAQNILGMMETQAYCVDSEQQSEVTKSSGNAKSAKSVQNVEPTLAYELMETQAYEESPSSPQPGPSTKQTSANIEAEPTLPYSLKETDSDKSGDVMTTQAYGLDNQTQETIPDSEEAISSQEILRPADITGHKDSNNNTNSKGSEGHQQPQQDVEEQIIVIRPLRRGRGRVTQGENQQTTKIEVSQVTQTPEEECNIENEKQKSFAEIDKENSDNTTEVSSSRSKRRRKCNQGKEIETSNLSEKGTTSLRSKRTKKGTPSHSENEQLDTTTDEHVVEAAASLSIKRKMKVVVAAEANEVEDNQSDIAVGKQNDNNTSAKALTSRRRKRSKKETVVPADEKQSEEEQEATMSSRRKRSSKRKNASEVNESNVDEELPSIVTTKLDQDDHGTLSLLKQNLSEAKPTQTVEDSLEETDDNSVDSTSIESKSRTKTRGQSKTKPKNDIELNKATQGRKPRKSTKNLAVQDEQKHSAVKEINEEKEDKPLQGRTTRKSTKTVVETEQMESASEKTGEGIEKIEELQKGRRTRKSTKRLATQEEQKQCVSEEINENTENNKEFPQERMTRKTTKKTQQQEQIPSVSENPSASKLEKKQEQPHSRRTRKSARNVVEQEQKQLSESTENEEQLEDEQETRTDNQTKDSLDATVQQTLSENTDDDFMSSRSSRTRRIVKQKNQIPTNKEDGSSAATSADLKDSEGDQFIFKGKSRTKKKGKQPKKLVKSEGRNVEGSSEEPVPHEDVLSNKIQEKTMAAHEEENEPSVVVQEKDRQFTLTLDSTQDSIHDSSILENDVKSHRQKAVSSRRGRGRVTQSEDTSAEDLATPSKRRKESSDTPSLRDHRHTMPRVMFTGVTDQQAEKIVKSLGGTIEESIYDCTHLITDKVRRTVKFLCAVAAGLHIILPKWLTECKRSKAFIDPEPYHVLDRATEKQYSFSLKQSLDQAIEKGLLDGYKVHVTKNVKPDPTQMKDIIKCARGEYLSRMPRSKEDNVLVISCEDDRDACQPAIACGIPVHSAELLLTGILRHELLLDQNLLFVEDLNETQSTTSSSRKRRNQSESSQPSSSSRSTKRKKK